MDFNSLPISILAVIGAAIVIGWVGTRLTRRADELADLTGWGEALLGAVFLGACTSLPGITASVVAGAHGNAELALSNAFGGITAQTMFLALADLTYRGTNLEHAAASLPNILSGTLLIFLLAVTLLAINGPGAVFLGVHIATPLLFFSYLFGLRLIHKSKKVPMWRPRITSETTEDVPDPSASQSSFFRAAIDFGASAIIIVATGWILTRAVEAISEQTGISQSTAGAFGLAVITSLPELVTTLAAVRQGALTLAVAGVLGGNTFDSLFAAAADVAYRKGSIYAAATNKESSLLTIAILMTAILLMGLLIREKRGPGNIGFESVLVLILYGISVAVLGWS